MIPESGLATWHKMVFTSPEGREEALWVEEGESGTYRVLSVPVWAYGISRGSLVKARDGGGLPLRFHELVAPSRGATVRFIVPPDRKASTIYTRRVIPDALHLGLHIGPATFFDPRLVSIHIHEREKWWPEVGAYLDALRDEGTLEQWEIADPDKYPYTATEVVQLGGRVLTHPLPVDGVTGQHVN